jgi:formyltetrahydrofolate hydrolase
MRFSSPHAYILTLSCPDRPGIVHAVSGFLLERGGNIEEAAQYNDHDTGLFFMRVRFACGQLTPRTTCARNSSCSPSPSRWTGSCMPATSR